MKKTARIATWALCTILSAQCFCVISGCSAKNKSGVVAWFYYTGRRSGGGRESFLLAEQPDHPYESYDTAGTSEGDRGPAYGPG